VTNVLGPKSAPNRKRATPFECGVPGTGSAHARHSVRFYLVAILFLLFDVEGIFFFPWAVVYKKYLTINSFILLEMGFFVGILLVGYVYVLRKGALEWE
jgi:NADH-quinone oxidoreductase subunit A